MAVDSLYDLAREYLVACEEAVALTPGGVIARSFVSAGAPSFDCPDQLSVHAGGPAEAETELTAPPLAPGHRSGEIGLVNIVALTATIIRCSPTVAESRGKLVFPKPAELDAVARDTMSDVWAVWNHVRTRYRAKTLFFVADRRRELYFDPASPVATSGGAAGWQIPIRVQLDGEEM